MIEAVIFDFGGVITSSPFDAFARFETERGLPADIIRRTNAANHLENAWARFERAEVDLDAFDELFAAESLALGAEVRGRDVLPLLSGDLRPEMVEALRRIKARFKTGCITNNLPNNAIRNANGRSIYVAEVMALTGGKGAELALDMVAGDYTQRNLDCLGVNGRLVTIAVHGGAQATINMAALMVKRQTITGSTMRARSDAFKAALTEEILRTVWPLVAEGRLRPEIDSQFALRDAAAAHARMEAGEHVGKIVLTVEGQ